MQLAAWSMNYSIHANLRDIPIQPLIDVNTNIIEGLQAQTTAEPSSQNAAVRIGSPFAV